LGSRYKYDVYKEDPPYLEEEKRKRVKEMGMAM
jgi:hypothetical protein